MKYTFLYVCIKHPIRNTYGSRSSTISLLTKYRITGLFGGFDLTWECFTHMDTSPYPLKGCKFWPIAFIDIEQWRFFSVPHLLWQGPTVYNGHLRWPVTLTLVAERLAVQLLLTVLTTMLRSVGTDIRTPNLLHARRALKPTVSLPELEYLVGFHLHVLHGLSLCYNMLVERYFFVGYPKN